MLQEPGMEYITVTASADSLSRNAEGNEPVSEVLKSIFFHQQPQENKDLFVPNNVEGVIQPETVPHRP